MFEVWLTVVFAWIALVLPFTAARRGRAMAEKMAGGVSITAGVCEEALYRGFVGFYLAQWMPLWAAALLGTLPFAAAHAYQGRRGVVRSGLLSLILWATYLATGSILPAMVLHAAIDVR